MMSHVFPGFLLIISLFMLIDSFCINPGIYSFAIFSDQKLEIFILIIAVILLLGTIFGIIIDGIQHVSITRFFYKKMEKSELNKQRIKIIKIINSIYLDDFLKEKGMKDTEYLFCWDEIPGNGNNRIIEFLKDEFKIEWAKTENISKIDDVSTIIVSNKEKSLSLKLNDEKTKVKLKIDDGRVDEFIVKTDNGKLNIYDNEIEKFKKNFLNWFFYYPIVDTEKYNLYIENFYYYYEFFANIFLVLLVTIFSVFCYTNNVLNHPYSWLITSIVIILAFICLYIAWHWFEACYKIPVNLLLGTLSMAAKNSPFSAV